VQVPVELPPDHADFMLHMYGKYTADSLWHCLGLKNAYTGMGELPLTNYMLSFQGTIDHVWYSTANLAMNAVLGEVDLGYLEKEGMWWWFLAWG
jgi:CCR4-NOT transcription complex subunit 6